MVNNECEVTIVVKNSEELENELNSIMEKMKEKSKDYKDLFLIGDSNKLQSAYMLGAADTMKEVLKIQKNKVAIKEA